MIIKQTMENQFDENHRPGSRKRDYKKQLNVEDQRERRKNINWRREQTSCRMVKEGRKGTSIGMSSRREQETHQEINTLRINKKGRKTEGNKRRKKKQLN